MMSFQLVDKQILRKKDNSIENNNLHINKSNNYKYNKDFNSNNNLSFNFSEIDIFYKNKFVQKKPICSCAGVCTSCKSQNSTNMAIQPKLRVSQPDDSLEREADKIAEQIVDMNYADNDTKFRNIKKAKERINGECSKCEEEDSDEEKPIQISKKGDTNVKENVKASNEINNDIKNINSGEGQPLATQTLELMESVFGYNLDDVRVHSDYRAAKSAKSIDASAYTVGNDIVFGERQYQPDTLQGRRLLAHELVHVQQQRGCSLFESPSVVQRQPADAISTASTHYKPRIIRMDVEPPEVKYPSVTDPLKDIVTIDDLDSNSSQALERRKVRSSYNYVDNAVVSVGASKIDDWTATIEELEYRFSDPSIPPLKISPLSINVPGVGGRPDKYVKTGGVIFPVTWRGTVAYDDDNTPKITHGSRIKEEQATMVRQQRLQMAILTFQFQLNLASLAAASIGIPAGKFAGGTYRTLSEGSRKIFWGSWNDYRKVVVGGEEYAVVGDRLYTRHAVDRMQPSGMRYSSSGTGGYPQIRQTGGQYDYGRSVAPQYVEDAIASSSGVRQPNGNISHTSGSLQVILSPEGRVVTIITH
jgi:hypothetical protein